MKNILIYLGIISCLFITPTTAPFIGVRQVGLTSSFLLLGVFLYEFLIAQQNIQYKVFREEFYVIIICLLYMAFKILDGNVEVIRSIFFFIMVPVIISILLSIQKSRVKVKVVKIVVIFFAVECLLAIYERIAGFNMFPDLNNIDNIFMEVKSWELRSTALLGHPLMNALGVSIVLGFILVSRFPILLKFLCLGTGFMAILSFNARGASIVWAGLGLYYLYIAYKAKKGSPIKKIVLILGFIAPLVYGVYYLLYYTHFGGRLINQETLIDGSAETRFNVFQSFDYIEEYDLWFGNPSNYVKIVNYLGAGGVENSYVVLVIQYGLLFGIPLILSLFLLVKKYLISYTWKQKTFLLGAFIVIGSLNNSLSGSTPWLIFVICSQCFPYFGEQIPKKGRKIVEIQDRLKLSKQLVN